MSKNSFGARDRLRVGHRTLDYYRLDAVEGAERLPYSLKVLLENLLRHEDGSIITAEQIRDLAAWNPEAEPSKELMFSPSRVLLPDSSGTPAVVDLAAMRDVLAELGGDASLVDPLIPATLVIDHSIIAEVSGVPDAFLRNAQRELERNAERYAFLKWGQQAFETLEVVPPNTGIVHQVNLEHLASVVTERDGVAFPDTLVGCDSHTPMVNGLGVLGWGVGGIEAEAAMLGQPISMLVPQVVGFELEGDLPEGATATDLVLTVTQLLREHGVVGRFVEFFGSGVANVPLSNRATIGNMSPEYGSTVTMFPIDEETLRYLHLTGRSEEQIALVEAYAKAQGMWHDPDARPAFSETLKLDLSTVEPSLAGPTRPQDRVALSNAKASFREVLPAYAEADGGDDRPRRPVEVRQADGNGFELDHGHVVIAAITSCTNTSNPSVMLAAGLLAKKAVDRGLTAKPWVKTSLAPGSKVVTDYFERGGLTPYLEKLGFHIVGYGCTTCIGNSGPLAPEISDAIGEHDLAVVSVLSGNRNFEGRINPDSKLNYLASPPLVVAYAIAGTMDIDLYNDPMGTDEHGEPVYLADVWPSNEEIQSVLESAVQREMFVERYANVFEGGDEGWHQLQVPSGGRFAWDEDSTYLRRPSFLDAMSLEPEPLRDISGARVLAKLGDMVTTDHISPIGVISPGTPAAEHLESQGVSGSDFNSYGSRRGNHEVMIRGTFANIRLRNQLAPGTEGGVTRHLPSGEQVSIYEASQRYAEEGTDLVVLAGEAYGTGSSRDWAAKGTILLGVKAILAQSFERIHRSNLIGMGVLPLELPDSADALGLTGEEVIDIAGLTVEGDGAGGFPRTVQVTATPPDSGDPLVFDAKVRIDTPNEATYYRHGGILQYVLRELRAR